MGYDELLYDRVTQLKEIDERLRRLASPINGLWDWDSTKQGIVNLRFDLAMMIQRAEEEHAAF